MAETMRGPAATQAVVNATYCSNVMCCFSVVLDTNSTLSVKSQLIGTINVGLLKQDMFASYQRSMLL